MSSAIPFGNEETNANPVNGTLKGLSITALIVLILGFLLILIIFWRVQSASQGFLHAFSFIIVAGAYVTGGAIGGFLFAIPRSGTYRYKENSNGKSWYDDNTNLEDISDWLTKIMVGVTLVQFRKILTLLDEAAKNIAMSYDPKCLFNCQYYPLAYGLIAFFAGSGFAIGYLWTRINFALILTISRERLLQIAKKKEVASALESKISADQETLNNTRSEVAAAVSQRKIFQDESASFVGELGLGNSPNLDQINKLIEDSKKIAIRVPDDLQKGRWGGVSVAGGKRLSATVTQDPTLTSYYSVIITVSMLDANAILESPIGIFVHDSFQFKDNVIIVNTNSRNEAITTLLAYEAFTVGAICLDGTKLELDLNEQRGFPSGFYWGK